MSVHGPRSTVFLSIDVQDSQPAGWPCNCAFWYCKLYLLCKSSTIRFCGLRAYGNILVVLMDDYISELSASSTATLIQIDNNVCLYI